MKVECPTCHAAVPAEDINIQAMTAVCRACNNVFSVAKLAEAGTPIGLPTRFTITDEGARRLAVSWRWWRLQYVFLIFFCCAWDGFLVFWYSFALFAHGPSGVFGMLMILFPIIHVAVGVGLTYFVIAAMFNRTWIVCDGDTLAIRHGPVPWAGNRSLPLHDLSHPRVETKFQSNSVPHYNVAAINNGRDIVLLKGLEEGEARWISQQLARVLSR